MKKASTFKKLFFAFFLIQSSFLIFFQYFREGEIHWISTLFQGLFFSLVMTFIFTRYNKVEPED